MRFPNIVAIIALLSVSAAATEEAGNLRGLVTEDVEEEPALVLGPDEDRDLGQTATAGGTAASKSFHVSGTSHAGDTCFDNDGWCRAYALAHKYANTETSDPDAFAFESLAVLAHCHTSARAIAKSYYHYKASGKLVANTHQTTNTNSHYGPPSSTAVGLTLELKTATMACVEAKTHAEALAYARGSATAYTSVGDYCALPWEDPVECGKTGSWLHTNFQASSSATSDGMASASSSSSTHSTALVNAYGPDVESVYGMLYACAHSWSVANLQSAATAMADAYVKNYNDSYSKMCKEAYEMKCDKGGGDKPRYCNEPDVEVACGYAYAYGSGMAHAYAEAFAFAYAEALAHVNVCIRVSASVRDGHYVDFHYPKHDDPGYGAAVAYAELGSNFYCGKRHY